MCGICGAIHLNHQPPIEKDVLFQMIGALEHRGPDENGGYQDENVSLGHTRLSIIDLKSGQQPMKNEDGTVWIVFNGEIFNYIELANELKAKGHHFRTQSDTETIIHAYEEWGNKCVERFNGQFAFAIYDQKTKTVTLARDRVGIRPLYYTTIDKRLVFASEVKSILQVPHAERSFDSKGLAHIFSFWGPVAPRTAFSGIKQLQPGCLLTLTPSSEHVERYYQPSFRRPHQSPYLNRSQITDLALELRDKLEEATKLRMLRADVPVGVYLSGGIDSSVIGSLVRRFHQGPLRTFSLRFKHQDFDEGSYQNEMVKRLNTDHQELIVDYHDIADAFADVVWYAEAPMLRAAPAPLFLLSKLVRQNQYKVVLTGEGSDEFLAGYDIFREDRVRRFWAKNPQSSFRPLLLERLYPWLTLSPSQTKALSRNFFGQGMEQIDKAYFSHIPRIKGAQSVQRLFDPALKEGLIDFDPLTELIPQLPVDIDHFEPLGKAQSVEIVTLLASYLLSTQGDRMLMGNSVEGRFPFLDPDVIEFANQLPPEAKLRVLDEKHLLKCAAEDLLPDSILKRPKQPYRAPDAQSFVQDQIPQIVEEVLSEDAIKDAGIFNPIAVSRLMAKMKKNRDKTPSNTDNMATIGIISTQLLHHQLLKAKRSINKPDRLTHFYEPSRPS